MLLATPYVRFESKKSQILIAHQKEGIDRTPKSFPVGKKVPLGFSGFHMVFLLLTTPYVMFESKKNQILIEFLDGKKKVQLAGKKSSARV